MKVQIKNDMWRCVWCEMCCTFFLLFVGTSVGAQTVLSRGVFSDYLINTLGWSITLAFAVLLGQRISGSHLNPAVSLFHWSIGNITFRSFLYYSVAQFIGAFAGAALSYLNYKEKFDVIDGGVRAVFGPNRTAHVFTFYPDGSISLVNGCVDQILGTALIVIVGAVVTDPKNQIPIWMQPAYIGTGLAMIGMALGMNAGYIINPARDLGPRVFSTFIYGMDTFSGYWWIIPITAPFFGALLGGWVYKVAISDQSPSVEKENEYVKSPSPCSCQKLNIRVEQLGLPNYQSVVKTSTDRTEAAPHDIIKAE